MAKIAMVVMAAHGHVNPTLALAEELVHRGHQVTYSVTEEFRPAVEAAGAKMRPFDSLMAKAERPKKLDPSMVLQILPQKILGETLHVLPQIDETIKADRPDFILYDNMCLAGRVLAEAYGIPAGALYTSYAGNDTFNLMRQLGELPPEARAEWDRLMAEISHRYAIEPFPFTDVFGHAEDFNLVFMPRMWQHQGESFDESFHFVGPCLGSRLDAGDFPREILEKKPLLFISLGTAFNDRPEFYRACYEAFGSSQWNVVMSVGTKTDSSTLGEAPKNFTVRGHVPQLEVLKHTTVFLTHGGMNSAMEALGLGVPLVALPQMFEQAVTARRIAEMGVGTAILKEDFTASELRDAVDRVAADPTIAPRAEEVRKAIHAAGGPRRAGDLVETHLASLKARLPRPERELHAP